MVLRPTRNSAVLLSLAALYDQVSLGWMPEQSVLRRGRTARLADRTGSQESESFQSPFESRLGHPNKKTTLQQRAILKSAEVAKKTFETARERSLKEGGDKEKRFKIKAQRDVKGLMEPFGSNATLDAYMALPLRSYNVKFFEKGSFDEEKGTFHLELPLSDVPSVSSALDGLSLVMDLQVDPDPAKRRNTFKATTINFVVDPARAAADAARQEQDELEIKRLNARALALTNQSSSGAVRTNQKAALDQALQSPNPGPIEDAGLAAAQAGAGAGAAPPLPPGVQLARLPPEESKQASDLAGRMLTRLLLKAKIELKGEATLEWAGPDQKLPGKLGGGLESFGVVKYAEMPWQRSPKQKPGSSGADEAASGGQGGEGEAKRGPSPKLRLRTEGTFEFTARGILSYFPSIVVNGAGSKIATSVLDFMIPRLLAFLSMDYSNWAQGKPRGVVKPPSAKRPSPPTHST
mmetsp:Transcript_53942/g.122941  ORF Transcript_53942/g.122941 Transcript_53942/m.122941 type:complete len:464 (+) Transcript_53942:141-1532(+)